MAIKVNKFLMVSSAMTALLALNTSEVIAQQQQIEEIIVTGELIDKSLLNTGNSAEVLDETALRNRPGLFTVRDVLAHTPNVSIVTGTGKAPTIRGIDGTGPAENANAFFAGSRARLNWQIDGRPANYNEIAFGDIGIWDLERIEILRGPQSTLVGRNAIAGSAIIKTNDPVFEKDAAFQLAGGNNDQQRGSLMLNTPINDQLAVRFAADWYGSSSAVSYQGYEGVDHPEERESLSIRGKLLFLPSANSKLLITLNHTKHKEPNSEIIVRPFDERQSNFPLQPVHEPQTDSVIADYSLALSEVLSLQVKASFSDFHFDRHAAPNTTNATIDTEESIFEPSLHYDDGNGLGVVVGMYFYRARQDEFIEFIGGQSFDDRADTAAVYGEAIIPLGSSFDLSVGARYEKEAHKRDGGDGALVQISSDESYDAFLPKVGLSWHQSENITWGAQISRGYNSGGGGITFAFPIVNYEYDAEYVTNFELFGRQEFKDGRIRTTQNIFFSDYTDMQLPFDLTPEDSHDEAFVVRNADEVKTRGVELGITMLLTDNWQLYGNLGVLDTEISDYPNSGVEGNDLLTAPNMTASLGLMWSSNHWNAALSGRFSDAYFTDVNNRPLGKTDSYVVADAQLSYNFSHYRVFASVRNLFDADDAISRYPGATPAADTAVLLSPRTYMLGLQVTF